MVWENFIIFISCFVLNDNFRSDSQFSLSEKQYFSVLIIFCTNLRKKIENDIFYNYNNLKWKQEVKKVVKSCPNILKWKEHQMVVNILLVLDKQYLPCPFAPVHPQNSSVWHDQREDSNLQDSSWRMLQLHQRISLECLSQLKEIEWPKNTKLNENIAPV